MQHDRAGTSGFREQDESLVPDPDLDADRLPIAVETKQTISDRLLSHTLRPAAGWFGAGLRAAIDIVYPPSCIACQAATGEAQALCPTCWGEMRFIERPYCERLGTPFAVDLGEGLVSPAAIADPPVFARARAVCRFDGTARELVHR
ncbi:MAG: double zinc ribbon domain-containing protein, partial [Bosea sp. (in: a-proteobacteria)]|nr:double zinc ribbon domain-containing protein [Bosea sp. (in: a-proteobacteria)]